MASTFGKIIVIKRNGSDGPRIPLKSKQCSFGRNTDCDIRIQLPNVLAEHAKLVVDNDMVTLVNMSADNPTLVNGAPITQKTTLKHNDVFTIINRAFKLEIPEPQSVKQASTPISAYKRRSMQRLLQNTGNKIDSPCIPAKKESLKNSLKKLKRCSDSVDEEPLLCLANSPATKTVEIMSLQEDKENNDLLQLTPEVLQPRRRKSSLKRVSFGGNLSPELFDKTLPPDTPLQKGSAPHAERSSSESGAVTESSAKRQRKRSSVSALLLDAPILEEEEAEPVSNCLLLKDVFDEIASSDVKCDGAMTLSPVKIQCDRVVIPKPSKAVVPTLATPLRQDIQSNPVLRQTKKKLSTPVRKGIQSRPTLKQTMPTLPTPLRQEIKRKPVLNATKKKLKTPLRKEIETGRSLRKTRQRLATPLRKAIEGKPELRKKKTMPTPLRESIQKKPALRVTKQMMATPIRKEIQSRPKLRTTKPKLPTPLREAIKSEHNLRVTKPMLKTPLRKAIKSKHNLRVTKPMLKTPLRKAIQSKLSLRSTRQKLATPLRKEIESGLELRSKKIGQAKLSSLLKQNIHDGIILRKTKKSLPSPLKSEIRSKPKLRTRILPSLPSSLKEDLQQDVKLRKTLPTAPTPFRKQIKKGVPLKATKKTMRKSMLQEIKSFTQLRKTLRKGLKTPIRKQIKEGKQLKKTLKSLPTPLKKDIIEAVRLQPVCKPSPVLKQATATTGHGRKILKASRKLPKQQAEPMEHSTVKDDSSHQIQPRVSSPLKKRARRESSSPADVLENGTYMLASPKAANRSSLATLGDGCLERTQLLLKTPKQETLPIYHISVLQQASPTSPNTVMQQPPSRKSEGLTGVKNLYYVPREDAAHVADMEGIVRMFSVRSKEKESVVKANEVICADGMNRLFNQRKPNSPVHDFDGLQELFSLESTEDTPVEVAEINLEDATPSNSNCDSIEKKDLIIEVLQSIDEENDTLPKRTRSRRASVAAKSETVKRVMRSCVMPLKPDSALSEISEIEISGSKPRNNRRKSVVPKLGADNDTTMLTSISNTNASVDIKNAVGQEKPLPTRATRRSQAIVVEKETALPTIPAKEKGSSSSECSENESVAVKKTRRNAKMIDESKKIPEASEMSSAAVVTPLPTRATRQTRAKAAEVMIASPAKPATEETSSTDSSSGNETGKKTRRTAGRKQMDANQGVATETSLPTRATRRTKVKAVEEEEQVVASCDKSANEESSSSDSTAESEIVPVKKTRRNAGRKDVDDNRQEAPLKRATRSKKTVSVPDNEEAISPPKHSTRSRQTVQQVVKAKEESVEEHPEEDKSVKQRKTYKTRAAKPLSEVLAENEADLIKKATKSVRTRGRKRKSDVAESEPVAPGRVTRSRVKSTKK